MSEVSALFNTNFRTLRGRAVFLDKWPIRDLTLPSLTRFQHFDADQRLCVSWSRIGWTNEDNQTENGSADTVMTVRKHYETADYWMRPSKIWRILQIKEGVIQRGRRPRWITPFTTCRIPHILRKPNSIIALFFVQTIFKLVKQKMSSLCLSAHQK